MCWEFKSVSYSLCQSFANQQRLPSGEQYPCDAGKRKHMNKNRYKDKFPCKKIQISRLLVNILKSAI